MFRNVNTSLFSETPKHQQFELSSNKTTAKFLRIIRSLYCHVQNIFVSWLYIILGRGKRCKSNTRSRIKTRKNPFHTRKYGMRISGTFENKSIGDLNAKRG